MKNQHVIPSSLLNQVNMKNLLLFCLATFFTLNYSFAQEKSMGCTPTVITGDPIQIGGMPSCPGGAGQIQFNGTNYQVWDPGTSSWVTFGSPATASNLWTQVGTSNDIYNTLLNRVGIGLTAPNHKLHVTDVISQNLNAASRVDFSNTTTSSNRVTAYGFQSLGAHLTNPGANVAARGDISGSFSGNTGESFGQLGAMSLAFAGAGFVGVSGVSKATAVSTFDATKTTAVLGGTFATDVDTDITLDNGIYWVGGVAGTTYGKIDNTPVNGAVAAVIGRDLSTGTAKSWAGYFEGDGYFSDQVIIGKNVIPTVVNYSSGSVSVSNFQLFVEGGILTEKIVLANCTDWADYVFADDYDLLSLEKVEDHINQVGHLHNTPSAADIEEDGLDVKEITINQQEKIEELFLHMIELNKQVKALQAENAALKAEVNN